MTTSFERPSRREVLKQTLLCATALVAAPLSFYPRTAHALTKEAMNYTDTGPGSGSNPGYCMNCKSFVSAGADAPGSCLVVKGAISPKGHCDAFSPKIHDGPPEK